TFLLVLGRGVRVGPDAELALAHHGVDPGDVLLHRVEPPVALQLAGGLLEAQVDQLLLGLAQAGLEVGVVHLIQLMCLQTAGHQNSPASREMKRVFMGSLCCARRMASRAVPSSTPDSSKSTRPGLTLATHHSGEPLPEPMRVSAGFLVSGRSGEMLIQTFPPRRMCRVMAVRAASICGVVT